MVSWLSCASSSGISKPLSHFNQQEGLIELKDYSSDLRTVGVIQNVYFTISSDQKMIVSYYFDPALDPDKYKISLSISTDGGITYFSPKSISGAIGKEGLSGRNTIEWDIFSDVEELVGDVQVKVEAEIHRSALKKIFVAETKRGRSERSILQRIFSASIEKKEDIDGLGLFIGVPWFNFSNDTYLGNIESELISHKFPSLGGGFTYISLPSQWNLSYSMNAFEYEYKTPEDWDDNTHVAVYQALDFDYLHSPFPNNPFVTPFLGLGFSLGEIYKSGYANNTGTGLSTSDLYYSGSLLIRPSKYLLFQISLKESIFRKVRKWNRVDMTVGVVL